MDNKKNMGRKILFPPVWLIFIFIILSAVSLTAVFLKGWEAALIAYPIYVISFYTLTVFCIACWKTFPGWYKNIRGKVSKNPYADRYLKDAAFKTQISLRGSLAINVIYVATNAVSAVIYKTHWFAIFSVYYGIMALMRFVLVLYVAKNPVGEPQNRLKELKRSRVCAYILMTVNLTLSGVVLMMVYYNRGFRYQGYLIYVMAVYTFYITIAAIKDLIIYRKYHSPVMSVSKIIKLASALFSMLFLETAMFSQFGAETEEWIKRIMIMATGAGISVIVVTMALYMIVKTTKEIKEYKRNKESG